MDALNLIKEERKRQRAACGWTAEHDDEHTDGSMPLVAALYASPVPLLRNRGSERHPKISYAWPDSWDFSHDKTEKGSRIRQLAKAGALIVAEIERLQRLEPASETVNPIDVGERLLCDATVWGPDNEGDMHPTEYYPEAPAYSQFVSVDDYEFLQNNVARQARQITTLVAHAQEGVEYGSATWHMMETVDDRNHDILTVIGD